MGGDSAPASVVDGADIARAKSPHIEILFVGNEKIIRPLLGKSNFFKNAEVFHTDQAVSSGDTASQAVRRGREPAREIPDTSEATAAPPPGSDLSPGATSPRRPRLGQGDLPARLLPGAEPARSAALARRRAGPRRALGRRHCAGAGPDR